MARALRERQNFSKVPPILEVPNLIEIQKRSFEKFMQKEVPMDAREDIGL